MTKTIYPASLLCDFYKTSHRQQYPLGTRRVFSTWIPRSNKYFPQAKGAVAFGFKPLISKYFVDYFNEHFFSRTVEEVVSEYQRVIYFTLINPGNIQGVEDPYSEASKVDAEH